LTGLVGDDSLALQQDERFDMAWNETDREKYALIRERCASDLSHAGYALIQAAIHHLRLRPGKRDRCLLAGLPCHGAA
jgi:hypothetical protein